MGKAGDKQIFRGEEVGEFKRKGAETQRAQGFYYFVTNKLF
jgi:hypothetical protein